ncbi:late embryogenesis abundant protein [Pistacia vera]|uniref:late embryogenesis abundant protein n=1 Tax=Pistacia vera TaxID=55513 RepID=UPI0012636A7D|nr:late embryogenesis abundant protein [Pistacia vera]
MADLRDECGNPIQLTDEHGNPVQLTDEYGNPMQLTGVALTKGEPTATSQVHGVGVGFPPAAAHVPGGVHDVGVQAQLFRGEGQHERRDLKQELEHERQRDQHLGAGETIQRSGSSSSSSSEDDGQGGRRKKGLKEKIKEKLGASGKNREEHSQTTIISTTTTTTAPGQHHQQEQHHEKKSMMEKIKEKLPGHHSH